MPFSVVSSVLLIYLFKILTLLFCPIFFINFLLNIFATSPSVIFLTNYLLDHLNLEPKKGNIIKDFFVF